MPLAPPGFNGERRIVADQRSVKIGQCGFYVRLHPLVDDIDFGVVGDGREGDVGNALVHEALADIAVGWGFGKGFAGEFGFLVLPFGAVRQEVEGVTDTHDAGSSESEGDSRSVDRDPATAPLLGNVGCCARAAGWIEDEIAGIGCHENATFE